MKATYLIAAAILAASPVMAEAPAGASGLDCDINEFTAIRGENGNILYWNNPTCPNGQGGMDPDHPAYPKPLPVEDDGDDLPVEEEIVKV